MGISLLGLSRHSSGRSILMFNDQFLAHKPTHAYMHWPATRSTANCFITQLAQLATGKLSLTFPVNQIKRVAAPEAGTATPHP